MSSEDLEAQKDELLALASIYDDEEFRSDEGAHGGEIRVLVDLPEDFRIIVRDKNNETVENGQLEYKVSFLPPLILNFEFPDDYPSASPPRYSLSCKWLTRLQLTAVCKHLDELWNENNGSVVLFTWMQFLKEDLLKFLNCELPFEIINGTKGVKKETLDNRAIQEVDPRIYLLPILLDFDQAQQQKLFDSKTYICGVCFTEKIGSACLYFKECKHVYCKACLTDYFRIQITDGNVHFLNCPEPECTSSATPAQVKELVEEDLFARYDRLLLQSSLDLMADIVYCPRKMCETAVMVETSNAMGICPRCQYPFCISCKKTYHGVSPCRRTKEEILEFCSRYLEGSEEKKKLLEQTYGKREIEKALEESCSEEWLTKNSKPCPRCNTNIQKVDGCNKMTCIGCRNYFCWVCLGCLNKYRPYSHFEDASSPCFNQLFEILNEDNDDED
ncbi:E3 ubiquitin-protein ligase RNF14 [Erpetoichthys calabaricus]|uniref:E3 ubiquitin-protein ligase RNF14 n=1 Tax=Erpetoichthys calabaricus TaxID=27687 RepID=A0A8C4S5U8_ERPCA|nr:E3 ubiquitin-protein ligase RNF14 [Erpetoichthys calabaricus]